MVYSSGSSVRQFAAPIVKVNNISSPVAVKKSKKKRCRSPSCLSSSSSSLSSSSSSDSGEYVRRRHKCSRNGKRKHNAKKKRKSRMSDSRREVRLLNNTYFERENNLSEISPQLSSANEQCETSVFTQPDISFRQQEQFPQMLPTMPSSSELGEQTSVPHNLTLNDLAEIATLQSWTV